jgi:hypothetical protein
MNVTKAKTINYLAGKFSAAASSDIGLTIKSAGGLEIGLGVLGKLSVGDNSTLSGLVQTVVGEFVNRVTVQLAYPILSALDFGGQTNTIASLSARNRQASTIRAMSSVFGSPNQLR